MADFLMSDFFQLICHCLLLVELLVWLNLSLVNYKLFMQENE